MATYFSNEAAVASMVIGGTPNETVTLANPPPPTNIPAAGFTPPSTIAIAAPADPTSWGDPHLFAANSAGRPHEGTPYDGYDSFIKATYNNMMPYTTTPNITHPSHPDYAGATVTGRGEDGRPWVMKARDSFEYASDELEDLEDEEEEAAEGGAGGERRGAPGSRAAAVPPTSKKRK